MASRTTYGNTSPEPVRVSAMENVVTANKTPVISTPKEDNNK